MRRQKHQWVGALQGLLLPVAALVAVVLVAQAVNSLDTGRAEEDRRQLEETLRRGCVACYATEGIYPPDLEYLKEHYGLQVDEERYTVHYSAIAENLMPDITVLENTP